MTDVASMLVSLVVGGLIGRWGTLAVEKERLVFERRVKLITQFLWEASRCTAEHVSGAVPQPDDVGKQKQDLVRLSRETRLLLPDRLDARIESWVDDYTHALNVVGGNPRNHPQSTTLSMDLHDDLTELRGDLKRLVSGSWIGIRLREAAARTEGWLPGR